MASKPRVPPGSKIGPYEVVALLGAGGMGEVYKGHDPRLGRHVAIKVLIGEFASLCRETEKRSNDIRGDEHASSTPLLLTRNAVPVAVHFGDRATFLMKESFGTGRHRGAR